MAPTVAELLARLVDALQGAGLFAGIVLAVYLPGRFVAVPLVRRAAYRLGLEENTVQPATKVLNAGFAVVALYLAVPLSGLATTPTTVAALTAAATLAVGFASRDVINNLVSGAFIVLDPRFRIGDWIVWKDREGVIEDISFRVTRLHTFDNELVTVPNSELAGNVVTMPAEKDRLRISQEFPISYEDSIAEAEDAIVDVGRESEEVLDRPRATVVVSELGDSAVILTARFWVGQPGQADVVRIRSEFIARVTERFAEEDIEMPYPTRELRGSVGTWERPADAGGDGG